jgi:hypothetical protein
MSQEYALKAKQYFTKATALGVTNLALNNYIETQVEAQKKFRNQIEPGD